MKYLPLLLFVSACCLAQPQVQSQVQAAPKPLPVVASGNHWRLPAGHYKGHFIIRQSQHIECDPDAVIDAGGEGHAVLIEADAVEFNGCQIINWGRNLTNLDAAIFVAKTAENTSLGRHRLRGPGFGIWVDAAPGVHIHDNDIEGDPAVRSQDRGNGIHLYAVTGARVEGNHVSQTRDGIYIDTSNKNHLHNNVLENLRYGVHYMFSHSNSVVGNTTRNTRTGYALMQSRSLDVRNNVSENDQNYGILMNYITYSTIAGNRVSNVQSGSTGNVMIQGAEGKALFIYNSVFNDISYNEFVGSVMGIHLTAGSENNKIYANSFINNQQQVKYVATRFQEWSQEDTGNYWSDYFGWDRNNDERGDVPYEPNDNIDRLVWLYPELRLLMNSPAIELLRWVQEAFPVVKSPGVRDSRPLMRPLARPVSLPAGEALP